MTQIIVDIPDAMATHFQDKNTKIQDVIIKALEKYLENDSLNILDSQTWALCGSREIAEPKPQFTVTHQAEEESIIFAEAKALATQLGISRSELFSQALQAYLQKHSRDQMLNKLNQVYTEEASGLDPLLARMQFLSLPHEDW
jgi:hypothetical protein